MINNGPTHHKGLNVALAIAGIVGVFISIVVYLENKKHKGMEAEILKLDKQIKELQLSKARQSV